VPAARRKTSAKRTARKTAKKHLNGPGALTPDDRKKMLNAIRIGLAQEDAARLIGIPRSTFHDWKRKAREAAPPAEYEMFLDEIDLALVEFEHRQLVFIGKAKPDDWVAAMTHLERKWPERYGKRTRVDSTVTVTAQPMWDTSKLTLEEKQELARLIRKCSPEPEELEQGQAPVLELLRGGDVIDGELVEEQ
jgi:transposase-like protein